MSLSPTIIYEIATGEIKSRGGIDFYEGAEESQVAAALAPWGADNHGLLVQDGDPDKSYVYVVGGVPTVDVRPPIPYQIDKTTITAGGTDFLTISGLHNPCDVIVDAPDPLVETTITTVTGGSFEFAAEDPGLYTIEISRFPFIPMKLEITVEEEDPLP